MKKTIRKKFLAVILSLVMVIGLLPAVTLLAAVLMVSQRHLPEH